MPDHKQPHDEMTQNEKDGMELLRRTSVAVRKQSADCCACATFGPPILGFGPCPCQCHNNIVRSLPQSSDKCPDCESAVKHAYSDATTPGFFSPKCTRHQGGSIGTTPDEIRRKHRGTNCGCPYCSEKHDHPNPSDRINGCPACERRAKYLTD